MENTVNYDFFEKIFQNGREWIVSELPGLIILIIVFIVFFKLSKLFFSKLKKTLTKKAIKDNHESAEEDIKRINTLTSITFGIVRIVLWVVFLMMLLKKMGVDIAPLLASAGIVGLAVGFGAQELVRDFISGFFIIFENQIRTGDVAIINGTGGLVEKIELRTITLRDLSGTVHVFQNGKINTLSNMTKEWSAMVFDIRVAYKEDPDKVMEIMKQVGEELNNDAEFGEKIIEPLEISGVDKFADSAVVIRARYKTKPLQQWAVGREYRKRLKKAFDSNNIEIPFPHTTVYWGEKISTLKLDIENKELNK